MKNNIIKKIAVAATACTLFLTGTAFINPTRVNAVAYDGNGAYSTTDSLIYDGWGWYYTRWKVIGWRYDSKGRPVDALCERDVYGSYSYPSNPGYRPYIRTEYSYRPAPLSLAGQVGFYVN
jgi:hypothetical protein